MTIRVSDYWFGTPGSLLSVLDAQARYRENPLEYTKLLVPDGEASESEDGLSPLIQVHEGVAVVQVNGPLTAQESWIDEYFGLVSYPALSRAVTQAVDLYESGDVHSVIHAFSTHGGDASGINGATEAMQAALSRAPDTISYTASNALSAGYWLASVNPTLRVDRMGELGSIGVVSTLRTIHRMLEADGVDTKVIRSGRYKALLSPYEPFSEEGLKMVEEKGHQLHQFFIDHLVSQRPQLAARRQSDWAEGQTFFGEKAIEMGLADGPPITLNALIGSLIESHAETRPTYYRGVSMASKVVVSSEEEQAKLAAGVDLANVQHAVVDEKEPDPETEQAAATVQEEDHSLTGYLQNEVKELKAELAERDRELAKLRGSAQAEALLGPIVVAAIHRLQVPLRQAPLQLEGLSADVLARQYHSVWGQFVSQFPVGQHALTEEDDSRVPADPAEQRLLLRPIS